MYYQWKERRRKKRKKREGKKGGRREGEKQGQREEGRNKSRREGKDLPSVICDARYWQSGRLVVQGLVPW
jgi:hypothetical protein